MHKHIYTCKIEKSENVKKSEIRKIEKAEKAENTQIGPVRQIRKKQKKQNQRETYKSNNQTQITNPNQKH